MEISVAKGKWVYQIDSGLRILITNYVYYDGIKKHKLYFQSGFGANTVSESVELNEVDFQNFMKNLSFTLKNNLKKRTKQSELPTHAKGDVRGFGLHRQLSISTSYTISIRVIGSSYRC